MASHPLPYEPYPTINPSGAPPGDFENIHATPEMFGGLIGAATEKLGGGLEKAGETATSAAILQQGVLNETQITNADTAHSKELSDLTADYKSKEGLAAVYARPKFDADVAALRQKYLQTLPNPAAQRGFDMLARRHEAYAYGDAATYAATQLKRADLNSANASSAQSIAGAGRLDVAQDDERFQYHIDSIDFATRRMMQNQGWGDFMHENPQTHALTFDDSPQGQQAEAVYEETNGKAVAMAYENRYRVLADQNVVTAYQKYQAERAVPGKVPGEAQVRLDAMFTPKIRDAETRTISDGTVGQANGAYQRSLNYRPMVEDSANKWGVDPNVISRQIMQESGFKDVRSSAGAEGFSQFIPGTAAKYHVDVHDPRSSIDGQAHYMHDLLEQFGGNYGLALAGYNWGENRVAGWMASGANPANMPLETRNYVRSITGQDIGTWAAGGGNIAAIPAGEAPTGSPRSQADYYRANYDSILTQAREQASALHPDDPRFIDMSVAKTEQLLNNVIRQQELTYKADENTVQRALLPTAQRPAPTSVEQLINVSPEVKAAWERMQVNSPLAAEHIESRILTANSREGGHDAKTYGAGFYDLFQRVHAAEGDPMRITDPTQLYSHIGPNGDLTVSGLDKLTGEIQGRRTPEGVAENEMKLQFLRNARGQITGTDEGLHIRDPKGDELYLKFMAQALPLYEAQRRDGKTPAQLLNPDSPDYVGKIITNFKRPMDQWFSDTIHDAAAPATKPAFDINNIKDTSGLISALRGGQITRVQADDYAIAHGWARRPIPAAAIPQLPLSQ